MRNNILIHIFAEKTAFYEKPSYIFRGLQISKFEASGLQIRWNGGDQDQLHLQYSPDVQLKQVELYDLQGRLVRVQQSDLEHVDLQGLSAGQYLMKVTLEDGKAYSDKVMKQ